MAIQAQDLTFDDLVKVVEPLVCKALTSPTVISLPAGIFDPVTLPLQEMSASDNPSVHLFDVITSYRPSIDFRDLDSKYKHAIINNDLDLLPEPFRSKVQLPKDTKLQIFVFPCSNGAHYIVKHYIFGTKCKPSVFMDAVYGKAHIYRWRATNPILGKKILQYTLENMGGHQMKVFDLQSFAVSKSSSSRFEEKTDDEVDAGFDFIQNDGPRSSSEMAQLRWMTKAIKNPGSPIFGWPTVLVEKALRNLATDGALAKKEYQWPIPLTSKYYHPWILEILEKVWGFDVSAFMLLGDAGAGKSPLGRSILMAQVRHNQTRFKCRQQPCIRCTPEIDFLRGEQGSVIMGDFLDDTHMCHLSMKMLKSILDVGLFEAMSWARWGAVKWVQNQPRGIADNTFAEEALPKIEDFISTIPFADFVNVIQPAFHSDITKAHRNAILKRSVILLNTPSHVYFRTAGIDEKPIPRISIPNPEFLTDAGKKLYGAFKNGVRMFPEDFQVEVRKEQEWVGKLIQKRLDERRPDHQMRVNVRAALFGDSAPSRPEPIFRGIDRESVRVKRELAETASNAMKKARTWSTELKESHTVIDLDSPPRRENSHVVPAEPLAPAEPSLPIPNPDFGEERPDEMDVEEELEDDVDPFGHGFDLNAEE